MARRPEVAELSGAVALQADAPAIAVFLGGGNDRPQFKAVQPADAPERVFDVLLFGLQLRVITDMLPGAAAAFVDERAWWRLARRRWREHAQYFADGIAGLRFNDSRRDPVARRGFRHHHGLAVDAPDAVRSVGERV